MTSQPFKNLKFCSTSVPAEIRLEMVSKIKAMGGQHFSHLMSDVDVLIVGDRDTDKYKYSVKHRLDITFVRPKSISSAYDTWVSGGELQGFLDDKLTLPIFDGLNICISRVSDVREKKMVIKLIRDHGGLLTDSLTINNTCVIATERSGKRYEKALEWGIPVVHTKWISDSIKRGAAMDYITYQISNVVDDQDIGRDSCDCWEALDAIKRQTLKKRPLQTITSSSSTMPTTTEETEKTVKVAKRENKLWNNIMGSVRPPSIEATRNSAWDETNNDHNNNNDTTTTTTSSSNKFVFTKRSKPTTTTTTTTENDTNNKNNKSKLFLGLNFGIYGFTNPMQLDKLSKVIKSHSGELISTLDLSNDIALVTHLLIPSYMTPTLIDSTTTNLITRHGIHLVTEWFIERCLHHNEIRLDKWGVPLHHHDLKLDLKICLSGFTGIELLHSIKLIEKLGCQYCDTLTAKRDLLVVNLSIIGLTKENSPKLFSYQYPEVISGSDSNKAGLISTKNKINACKKWDIPIVSMAYLMELSQLGYLPELMDYQWCIFAPKTLKKHIYDSKKSSDIFETSKLNEERKGEEEDTLTTSSSMPKLPSPLKKKKKNWGRLIGRAQESQLGKDFLEDRNDKNSIHHQLNDIINENENNDDDNNHDNDYNLEQSTQISYNDKNKSNSNGDEEKDISNNNNNNNTKNSNHSKVTRRDTRAHLRELNHDLE